MKILSLRHKKRPTLSITLPSIYPEALDLCLTSIARNCRVDYEVVVVSPFPVAREHVVWIEETKPLGCAFAHNLAVNHASGTYVTAFADDWLYEEGWDEIAIAEYSDRASRRKKPLLLGLRYSTSNEVGTVFGKYYANFPFTLRRNLRRFGWIGPDYKLGFGDVDLSFRFWSKGGRCEFSKARLVKQTPEDTVRKEKVALCSEGDLQLFLLRWKHVFGNGFKTDGLRDFNLDVDPDLLGELAQDQSIFLSDPASLALLKECAVVGPRIIKNLGSCNIVRYRSSYYVVSAIDGHVDATDLSSPNNIVFEKLDDAISFVCSGPTEIADRIPFVAKQLHVFNIVRYKGICYLVPLALGEVDVTDEQSASSLKRYVSFGEAMKAIEDSMLSL